MLCPKYWGGITSKHHVHCLDPYDGTSSLLPQPGPEKFKLSKIERKYKAKKFKVPPFTV